MKNKILSLLTLALFLCTVLGYSAVQEAETLVVGETRIFDTRSPARVAITNPQIADIAEVTASEIVVSAKSPGRTKFFFQDTMGEHSFQIKVISEDMNAVKERVDNLLSKLNLPEVYTKAEDEEGKVFILGDIREESDRQRINLALGPLAAKTVDLTVIKEEKAVVNIDVQVLEVDKDSTTTLGLTNPLSTTSGLSITEIGSPALTSTTWGQIFRVTNVMRPTAFNWTLYALIQEGKARILSRPRLACQSGKEAELLVGGEKPILTTDVASAGGQGTEVEYKEFGIKLRIRPTVTEEKRIKLGLNVEVSEVGTAEFLGTTSNRTAQAYPLTKRSALTELFLDNGQTMAIGGLIKQKKEEDITRTPWLSKIPILGALFKKTITKEGSGFGERGDVELFITLTPTIVGQETASAPPQKESKPPAAETSPPPPPQETTTPAKTAPAPVESAVYRGVDVPARLSGYASVVQRRISENLTYPAEAKDAAFEGTVKLRLHLSYNGELLEAGVEDSSGYKMLDDDALLAARKSSPYPPLPPSLDAEEIWVEIPILYRID